MSLLEAIGNTRVRHLVVTANERSVAGAGTVTPRCIACLCPQANRLWEAQPMPGWVKPAPTAPPDSIQKWIENKYQWRGFLAPCDLTPSQLDRSLFAAVEAGNVVAAYEWLWCVWWWLMMCSITCVCAWVWKVPVLTEEMWGYGLINGIVDVPAVVPMSGGSTLHQTTPQMQHRHHPLSLIPLSLVARLCTALRSLEMTRWWSCYASMGLPSLRWMRNSAVPWIVQ